MLYQFSPLIQAGIEAGKNVPVVSQSGVPLSIVRHAVGPQAGQFAAHAIGIISSGNIGLDPITAASQLIVGSAQIQQGQKILGAIQSLSGSVATLQATTAVLGVGVATSNVLSAVNLWQTLKLRQDIKAMRLEIYEGFLNLHEALSDQGKELLEHIDRVAEDVEFASHKTILIRAYGKFNKALNRLRTALLLQDQIQRNDEIANSRNMLFDALADYDNSQLMEGISSVSYLRRRECVWAIEQAIIMTYQMQGEFSAVVDRLIDLDQTIRQDVIKCIDKVDSFDELEFIFPEVWRIHDHDLIAINSWNEHIKWHQGLSESDLQQLIALPSTGDVQPDELITDLNQEVEEPPEYSYWEQAQRKSHFNALSGSLIILMDHEVKQKHQDYIVERSQLEGLFAITQESLKNASALTIANLAYYFLIRDDSLDEEDQDE